MENVLKRFSFKEETKTTSEDSSSKDTLYHLSEDKICKHCAEIILKPLQQVKPSQKFIDVLMYMYSACVSSTKNLQSHYFVYPRWMISVIK